MEIEGNEQRDKDNDVTDGAMGTSSNNDVTSVGLNSRTQSFTSVTSSQVSRGSKLPNYDFEDDRPGKYKGGKTKDKKKIESNKPSKNEIKKKKSKDENKTKEKKEKNTEKAKKKEDKSKKEKTSKDKKEKNIKPPKDKKDKKKTKSEKQNGAFLEELEDTFNKQKISDDVASTSQGTSREPSVTSEKDIKKKKNGWKNTRAKEDKKKRGRSKTKKDKKDSKKDRSLSRASSEASFTDVTDDLSDFEFKANNKKKPKKSKKADKKGKKGKDKNNKNNDPVVVIVNDDDDDTSDVIKKRKMFLGICPAPSKREPLVYNCCVCCSLGAGSLISGIIFVLFCIGYLVIRAEEFKVRAVSGIWRGHHLLPDVWRVCLVFGFITASLCLLASLLLVVGSCLWGSKERYKRIRRVIMFWFFCATTALINNVGEAVFIQTMPDIKQASYFPSDSIKEIKANNIQLWAITGLFTVFFLYITLVLVSYLRLLKYMDSPKIGTNPTPVIQNPDSEKQSAANSLTSIIPSKRQRRSSLRSVRSEAQVKTVSETPRKSGNKTGIPEIPLRKSNRDNRGPRTSVDDIEDRIYVNTSFLHDDESGTSPDKRRPETKSDNFKQVLEDLNKDENVFENLSKPRPLKRMPIRRPRAPPVQEGIYMNHDPQSTLSASYTKISKPLKRAASLSDVKSPVYDCPPPETDLKEIQDKKNNQDSREVPYGSGDTGFNSRSSVTSSIESHPGISEVERLSEELRQKQEALDRSGNCDPATAENLTQMALSALKLSEKILQDVKSNENDRITPMSMPEEDRPPIQHNVRLAESFFDELSRDPNALTENPIEEMFRMYGKDLCGQNPEMVNRYLMSYKTLQQNKARQQRSYLPDTGISDVVMHEQKPWRSILNPSEAIPAVQPMMQSITPMIPTSINPLASSISQSTMGTFHGEDPRFSQSAFTPTQQPTISQPFHTVSHAQSGPPPPNSFFPIDYPLQNSASYNQEPPKMMGQQNSMVPYKGPPPYDHNVKLSHHKYPPVGVTKGGFPYRRVPYDDNYYYDEECPYSCCYGTYDDYGSIYGEFGPYMGSEAIYGETGRYTGANWFPLGDPTYSIDPYYNPYEMWDEPAPPYTEESTNTPHRSRSGSRGYDSKATSASHGSSSRYTGSKGYSGRTGTSSGRTSAGRGYSYKSRSLPDLLDEDLYSERSLSARRSSRSIHNLAKWGIENDAMKDSIGRPSSRLSRGKTSSRTSGAFQETTRDAFMKGYKAALKEALVTISAKKEGSNSRKESSISSQDDFIERIISEVSDRQRSKSPERTSSNRDSRMARTISSESRFSNGPRRTSRENGRSFDGAGQEPRNLSRSSSARRSSRNGSRLDNRDSEPSEKLSSTVSRRASKLSFRPSSRPGQPIFDDYYDDYRSTSSVPPKREELDDFGFPRRNSSRNSSGFKSLKSATSRDSDEILSAFEMMSSHGGRPSTRSRLSGRTTSQSTKDTIRYNDDRSSASYPYSENESHFYNKLDLEKAFPESPVPSQDFSRGRSQDRDRSTGQRSRSQSANSRRREVERENVSHERSRSVNETRRNDKEVLWFMGDETSEPIYSEYEGFSDSLTSDFRPRSNPQFSRRLSYPEQSRVGSVDSSKRKSVTFDKRPKIKEVSYRRTSWN